MKYTVIFATISIAIATAVAAVDCDVIECKISGDIAPLQGGDNWTVKPQIAQTEREKPPESSVLPDVHEFLDRNDGGSQVGLLSLNESLVEQAMKGTDPSTIEMLISRGANVDALVEYCVVIRNKETCTDLSPLHIAAYENPDPTIVEALLLSGADIRIRDPNHGFEPIHLSARNNPNSDVTGKLIEYGADVGSKTAGGKTPLHYASRASNSELVSFLVSLGADIRTKDNRHNEPIHEAAWSKENTALNYFLQQGIDPDTAGNRGFTPLHYALQAGNHQNVLLLLHAGADVNAAADGGLVVGKKFMMTPLMLAVHSDHRDLESVKALIDYGADINEKNNGFTTLTDALNFGAEPVFIEGLLKLGANPKLGVTPATFVHVYPECEDLMDMLVDYGYGSFPLQSFFWCDAIPDAFNFFESVGL